MTSENYEQSYRAQINEKVLSTRLFKLCGSDLMRPRYRYRHSPGHFLTLLGVVGHFSHIVGSQVRVESHFSHVVANWWKVAFLILLEVKARSGKSLFACWASSGKSPFLIIFRSGGAQRQREGGNSLPTPNNMRKVLMGIRFFLAFLILLGVEGEFPPLSLG